MLPITIIEPTASNAMPDTPFPLVQPSAMFAPNTIINPPTKAIIARCQNDLIFAAIAHTGEILALLDFARVAETYAPIKIPNTKPNCHQCFSAKKHWLAILWYCVSAKKFNKEQATLLKECELPMEACSSKNIGICNRPIIMPAKYGDQ